MEIDANVINSAFTSLLNIDKFYLFFFMSSHNLCMHLRNAEKQYTQTSLYNKSHLQREYFVIFESSL